MCDATVLVDLIKRVLMRVQFSFVVLLVLPALVSAQPASSNVAQTNAGTVSLVSQADRSVAAAEILALEAKIGAAIVGGDAAYFDSVTANDFTMTHGDAWTRGGMPTLVDDKASFLKRVASKSYAAHDYESVSVEIHGDVAITYGRYIGHIPASRPERAWFSVSFLKVYAKRDGRWTYLSHRTVRGANYGLDRRSVADN